MCAFVYEIPQRDGHMDRQTDRQTEMVNQDRSVCMLTRDKNDDIDVLLNPVVVLL